MRQNKCAKTKNSEDLAEASEFLPPNRAQADDLSPSGRLNFSAEEFNRIDDLDDNIGNYREFESLDGVVTSDMRYHEKRKQKSRSDTTEERDKTAGAEKSSVGGEEEEGVLQPLTVVSTGRLLIIDGDFSRAVNCAHYLRQRAMTCTLCLTNDATKGVALATDDVFAVIVADSVVIDGCFGGFTAAVGSDIGGQLAMSGPDKCRAEVFDLVLDLQATPSFAGKQLPTGYFSPGPDAGRIYDALEEIAKMRGRFRKQQLTAVRKGRCINERSRFRECRQCMDVCPFNAVTQSSKGRRIVIDQYRCQGCGWCAQICPTDAIELQHPRQQELLIETMGRLSGSISSSSQPPDLFLYSQPVESDNLLSVADRIAAHPLLLEVDEIGRVGLESLLMILACGAASVTLVFDKELPADLQELLKRQVYLGKDILSALQIPEGKMRLLPYGRKNAEADIDIFPPGDPVTYPVQQPMDTATLVLDTDRRNVVRQMAEYLNGRYGPEIQWLPLSIDAPFGTISISSSCSFCMACVSICPSEALQTGGEMPRLSMVESRCLQCSLCEAVCPEQAIEMLPRLLLNWQAADSPAVLREEEPFHCVECGKPFASRKMVSRMEEKLSGHWMYNSHRQARRLQMCRACRTHDALVAGDFQP